MPEVSALLPPLSQLLACCAIVGIAAYVQVSVGMGFGTMSAPLIAAMDPSLVPVSIMIMGLVVSTIGAWRERSNIVPKEVKLGFTGRIAGMLVALGVLSFLPDQDTFALIFGIFVLLGIGLTVSGWRVPFTDTNLLGLSVLSGLMGTITSVGAPPMALAYLNRPPHIVRPTLNAFFGIGCAISLTGLGLAGWVELKDMTLAAVLLLPMMVGIAFAKKHQIQKSSVLTNFMLAVTTLAALSLVWRGL